MPPLGHYPTPVTALTHAAARAGLREGSLYCKRDDLTSDVYGGNKVRKLERLLDEARARGAERIITASRRRSSASARGSRSRRSSLRRPRPTTPRRSRASSSR